jgi:hypothetical protein
MLLARLSPQPLMAFTDTLPAWVPAVTAMLVVPWPAVITQSAGTTHV